MKIFLTLHKHFVHVKHRWIIAKRFCIGNNFVYKKHYIVLCVVYTHLIYGYIGYIVPVYIRVYFMLLVMSNTHFIDGIQIKFLNACLANQSLSYIWLYVVCMYISVVFMPSNCIDGLPYLRIFALHPVESFFKRWFIRSFLYRFVLLLLVLLPLWLLRCWRWHSIAACGAHLYFQFFFIEVLQPSLWLGSGHSSNIYKIEHVAL